MENWLDGIDISSSPADLTEYLSLKYDEYTFSIMGSTIFNKVHLPILQRSRKFTRKHGVYIRKIKILYKTFSYISGKLQYIKEKLKISNTISSTLPTPSMIPTPINIDTPSPKQIGRPINPNQTIPSVAPYDSKHLNFNPNPSKEV
ncbi:hypothetical protein HI914_02449 [Erysiphe necator]|nr:hypothetical protein HI914_02449 [Erysiphe necator]